MPLKAINDQINFDLLFKNHPQPMWIYDIQSLAFLEVNDAAVKKYGYSRKKFLTLTLKDIRPNEDVERLIKDVSKNRPALQQSRNWRHILKSGKIIDVEITSHTIKYNERKAALVTAKDITDKKLAEEKIIKLNKVYAVLSDVNQAIVRIRDAKKLYKNICRIAVKKGGYAMAWIGMVDTKENKVKVIASAGVTKDYLKKINIDLNDKKRGGGPTGLAVKTGKHVISNNIESDKRMLPWRKDAIKYGYKSSASFPIKVFGKVVGSFTLYSLQELFFNDEEINLLDEMAMDLSFALEFIEEEKVKREAEEKLRITQFGIDHSQIGVYQIDEEGNINYANEQACKSLGYTYKELTSKSVLDIDPTFSLKKWKEHRKNIRKEGSGTIETIHKRKDGSEFFVEVSINYFEYDDRKLSFSFAKDITDRKLAEKALRESEENLSITLHSIGDAVISTDNKGIINKMNPTAEKLCGWKISDAKGKHLNEIFRIINADSRLTVESPFDKVIKTGKVIGLANHTILISRDGAERNIADSAAPIKNSKGNIKGVVLVFSDVTEAYKTRKELESNEQLLKESQKIARLGNYTWDLSKGFWTSSEILDDIFGIDKNYTRSLEGWAAIIHPDFREIMKNYVIDDVIGKRKSFDKEYKIVRIKDGKELWVHGLGELELDTKKKPVRLNGTISDITERKVSDELLRESEEKFFTLFEKSPIIITLSKLPDGTFVAVNEAFEKEFGFTKDEALGKNSKDLGINPEAVYRKRILEALKEGNSVRNEEMVLCSKSGDIHYYETNIDKVVINGEEYLLNTAQNISDFKKAQNKLKENYNLIKIAGEKAKLGGWNVILNENRSYWSDEVAAIHEMPAGYTPPVDDGIKFYAPEWRGKITEVFTKCATEGIPYDEEMEIITTSGKRVWIRTIGEAVRDENGKIVKVQGAFQDISERKHAEEKLKESETRFRKIFEDGAAGMVLVGNDFKFRMVNQTFCKMTGYTEEELLQLTFVEITHPDDRTKDIHDVKKLIEGKIDVYKTDKRYLKKDGQIFWAQLTVSSIYDLKGGFLYNVAIIIDITERKLAEQKLMESEMKFRSVWEKSTDGMRITNEEGLVILANDAYCRLGEKQHDEIEGKPISVIQDGSRRNEIIRKHKERFLSQSVPSYLEKKITLWNGKEKYVVLSNTFLEIEHQPALLLSVFRDVTEHKRAEEELSNERVLLKNIIDSIPNPIYVKDLNGRRIIANKAEALFAGKKSVDEILGKTNFELFTFDFAEQSRIEEEEIIKTGKPLKNIERNFTSTDGNEYWYIGNKVLLKDSNGNPFGILAVNLDITDRKLMEEQLQGKENQMRMIVEGTPQLFFYTQDVNSKVTYISPSVKKITGRSVEEWLNQSHWFITNNEINEYAKQATHAHLRGELIEGPILVEVEHADKHPILLEVYESPIIRNKKVVGLQGVAHDISERKRAEQTLRESEDRFRNLIENINEVFYISDRQGRIEYCSPNIFNSIGYTAQYILGKSYLRLVAPIDHRLVIDHYLEQTAKGVSDTQLIFRVRCKDGKIIWVEQITNIVRDTSGKVVGFRNVARDITERKRTEKDLQESEERYRSIFENSHAVMLLINPENGEIVDANPAASKFYGYTKVDLINKNIAEINTLSAEVISMEMQSAKDEKRNYFTFKHKLANSELRDVEVFSGKVKLKGKEFLYSIVHDITERIRAEEDLRKSKEELQKFFEDDLSANYISTPSGQLLNCNKTFLNIFGFKSIEEALEFSIEKLYSDSAHRNVFIDLLKKNKKVESFECEYVSLDGKLIYTIENAVAEYDSKGKFIQIRGYIVNITKRKIAEEELKKRSRAVEQSPASVLITNQDGDIEYVNEKFCEVTGYSKEEAIGKNPRILKSGYHDKIFYEEFWNHILSGKDWKGEMRNKKKNGELYWESVLISPLVNNEGDITHFVAVKEDITEKKIMLEELIDTKEKAESANKLKDAFIANMSHEIRTPLNGILGLTSIIKDIYAEHIKEEDEELFSGVEHSSKRIIRTVDMILNYSRVQTGEFPLSPKKIELSSICENLVKEFNTAAKSKTLELSFKNKIHKKVMIFGDEYSITHSISNLIDNAIKYTNKGFVNLILYTDDNDKVLLDVKDSGIGISKDYIQNIFEPYQQEQMGYGRAYEGVGLGLPIVKKFLSLNNADISVDSKKGQGTTFTINFGKAIELTISNFAEEKIIKKALPQEKDKKQLVLIVEDDMINQSTIKRFIGSYYSTIVTDNSEMALEILKTNKIDLILMDISIKGNKNGLELTQELKSSKNSAHIPVIAITAHSFDKDKQNALESGCDDYLSKPFSKKLLLDTIGKFV